MSGENGRPAAYKTAEELENKIEEYRLDCIAKESNPTITGLAYFLGFSDRRSFYDYEKKEKFTHTIKRARLWIESIYESRLFSQSPTGSIFALKNFGWKDKTELEHSGDRKNPIQITLAPPPPIQDESID
jgi:hypothetical protein